MPPPSLPLHSQHLAEPAVHPDASQLLPHAPAGSPLPLATLAGLTESVPTGAVFLGSAFWALVGSRS